MTNQKIIQNHPLLPPDTYIECVDSPEKSFAVYNYFDIDGYDKPNPRAVAKTFSGALIKAWLDHLQMRRYLTCTLPY